MTVTRGFCLLCSFGKLMFNYDKIWDDSFIHALNNYCAHCSCPLTNLHRERRHRTVQRYSNNFQQITIAIHFIYYRLGGMTKDILKINKCNYGMVSSLGWLFGRSNLLLFISASPKIRKNENEHEEMRARVSNNYVTIQQLIWTPLFRCSRCSLFRTWQPIFNIIKYQIEIKCPRVLRLFTTQHYEWRAARCTFGFYRISVLLLLLLFY